MPLSAQPPRRGGAAARDRGGRRLAPALSQSQEPPLAAGGGPALHGLEEENVCIGNGSDDILNLLVRCYCGAGAAAGFTWPSYSLYPVLVGIQDGKSQVLEFDRSLRLPVDRIAASGASAFFLTSPNAPTGVGFANDEIEGLLQASPGLLVVDEAYAPFARENAVPLLSRHPNLVVVRTLSKAYALAGLRVGYALAHPEVIGLLDRVRDSYNVNRLSQAAALAALGDQDYYNAVIARIQATRDAGQRQFAEKRRWFTYPSQANFIFTEPKNARGRSRPGGRSICLRFPVRPPGAGAPFSEPRLDRLLPPRQRRHRRRNGRPVPNPRRMAKGASQRVATVVRQTAETDIAITLAVDGRGVAKIDTGVSFFDHMLTLFAKHGLFDLTVKAKGDTDVDYHHTVEDVGLVLGQAFREALGDKIGIRRYGFFYLPMDEALARVVVDVGGRPLLVYKAEAPTLFVRDFNIALVKEFCRAFSNTLGANLHVHLQYGEEPHHVAEAIFKALGRALDVATSIEPRAADLLPSTKGKI